MTDQPKDTRLWCLHHIGPDDMHPAPDFATAQKWADYSNRTFAKYADVSRFVVALWPWRPAAHAEGLQQSVKDWALPEQPADAIDCIAQAIYEMNPCGEQPTDLDGRPTGRGVEVPWSQMIEYDTEYHDACMEAARKIGALATPARTDAAAEERDALLSALGWKTGPFPDAGTRKVVLEDSAGLRPEMVKARRRADDVEADRDIWRMIAGERVEEARSGLLIRVWNRMKEERKLRIKAEAAIAGPAAEDKARIDFLDLRRPIKGIEYRSAEEVFAIMADRIRLAEGGHYRLRGTSPAEPERNS